MKKSTHPQFIRRHLMLLIAILVISGAMYWFSQSILTIGIGGMILILVHLAAVSGFLYFGGSRLIRFIRKLHTDQ